MEKILIVDDYPATIRALVVKLQKHYHVDVATSGAEALELALASLPDLILLDVMMPGMDGYELCSILKESKSTCNIPIIFVTARAAEEDEERGLALGAVDYLTKPFSTAIVSARIRTHLDLKRHHDNLEKMVDERTEELNKALTLLKAKKESEYRQAAQIHSGRLAALGEMATSMAHEINQPLNVLSITLQGWQLLERRDALTKEKMLGDVQILLDNVGRITKLIDHVRTLGHASQDVCSFSLAKVLQNALSLCRMQFLNHGIEINLEIDENVPEVDAIESEVEQVILNILSNARYALAEKNQKDQHFSPVLSLSLTEQDNMICLAVKDNGGGVEPMAEENIFDPFFTTKPAGQGTGLGLNICKQLMLKFDGDITLENNPGQGACFKICLPGPDKKE
ncbi:MAG: response regulator [Desulfobulbaceae bacterium]|nr:response regulator [Desulfobulbaceae bacterium]